MAEIATVTEALATLILQGKLPLEAVAIAGEVIAIDARICSYDKGSVMRASLEKWSDFAEAYEVLLRRAQFAADEFAKTRDGRSLIQALEGIKRGINSL